MRDVNNSRAYFISVIIELIANKRRKKRREKRERISVRALQMGEFD